METETETGTRPNEMRDGREVVGVSPQTLSLPFMCSNTFQTPRSQTYGGGLGRGAYPKRQEAVPLRRRNCAAIANLGACSGAVADGLLIEAFHCCPGETGEHVAARPERPRDPDNGGQTR